MSAPLLWIFIPILLGGLSIFIARGQTAALFGGVAALILAGIALIVPIDEALRIGPVSLKIASSVSLLGRSLVLDSSHAFFLAVIYGVCAFWYFGAQAAGVAQRLVPLGLIITGLLVASIAVQPFLFAALLIETAVLVAVPLIVLQNKAPGPGVLRFLIYQTLAMPFILFAGWLLAGVEASPGDLALTVQSTVMLGLGFAFLLGFFPLYNWMPQLMQEAHPYSAGFLLWILPTIASIYGMGFLDRYAWLRTSSQLLIGLRVTGLLMVVTGGLWTAFQRHAGRLMAYAAVAEIGFMLLALTIDPRTAVDVTFLLLPTRGLGLLLWSLSLSVLRSESIDGALSFRSMQGMARSYPLASAGLVLAALSTAGFPLLAGFPARLALWEGLAQRSLGSALWFLIGLLGLMIGAVRMLAVLIMDKRETPWALKETWVQRSMLAGGLIALFVLGVFPQAVRPILEKLPLMFQHLGH